MRIIRTHQLRFMTAYGSEVAELDANYLNALNAAEDLVLWPFGAAARSKDGRVGAAPYQLVAAVEAGQARATTMEDVSSRWCFGWRPEPVQARRDSSINISPVHFCSSFSGSANQMSLLRVSKGK
jgi:hypothetical protein